LLSRELLRQAINSLSFVLVGADYESGNQLFTEDEGRMDKRAS
jgi:hypothetical protein